MKFSSILSIILTLAMLLALASCGSGQPAPSRDASTSNDDASVSDIVEEEGDASTEEEVAIDPFFDIIETYQQAFTQGWDREQLRDAGLNEMALDCLKLGGTVGFQMTDCNWDGIQELIIGCSGEDAYFHSMILQLYAIEDGEPTLLMESKERNRWYWCDDGTALAIGSSSASQSSWYLCTTDRETAFIDCVEYDHETSPDQPWSIFNGETWNHVSEGTALAKVEELEGSVCDMNLIALNPRDNGADENGYIVKSGIIEAFMGLGTETTTPADADTIGNGAFSWDLQHGVNLSKVRVTGNIKTIEAGAFSFTAADVIYLEEGVESIGGDAFSDSYIDEIWFPSSVTHLGEGLMTTEEGLQGTKIHVVEGSAAARYFEEDMPYGECELVYDYQ